MPHVDRSAVFHLEPTVFHDAIFVASANSDFNRDEVTGGLFDRLDGPLVRVFAGNAVAMAGVCHHVCGWNAELPVDGIADFSEVVVFDVPDPADGNLRRP